MNIKQITDEVVSELRHPHAVAEIKSAVRKAVRAIHSSGLYRKDLVEEVVQLNGQYSQAKVTLPPFFRKFEKVQPCSLEGRPVVLNTFDGGIPIVKAGDIQTMAGNEMQNFLYQVGSTFVFRVSTAVESLFLTYYSNPDLEEETRETWVTQEYYDAVKDGAKYMYLLTKNEAERANAYKLLYDQQIDTIFTAQAGNG